MGHQNRLMRFVYSGDRFDVLELRENCRICVASFNYIDSVDGEFGDGYEFVAFYLN